MGGGESGTNFGSGVRWGRKSPPIRLEGVVDGGRGVVVTRESTGV